MKYIPKDWEKMKEGIGDLTGLGVWGKGMIDLLKDITENLERAEEAIRLYDSDGVISFQHTNQKSKYDKLFEDYNVLHKFAGNVGDLVDRTIDDPFYKDMDAFVEAMRDLDISKYTTTNRIGATETVNYATEYGSHPIEVKKKEVNIQDLFNADNFYAKQIKAEYDEWKVKNPKKDLSEEDFQKAVVNMHAFKYESIKDKQESKEFWAQIGALVVIVGATIICPPAGMVLGAAYGTLELSSAVSGKDWVSGRELETGERVFRGILAPLDIVPGVSGLAKFSNMVRLANMSKNLERFGLETGFKASLKQSASHVNDMVKAAGEMSVVRLRNAKAVVKDWSKAAVHKVAKDAVDAGKLADNAITKMKNTNLFPGKSIAASDMVDIGKVCMPVENTHDIENKVRAVLSKIDGINLGNVKKFQTDDIKTKPKLQTINHGFETELDHAKLPQGKGFAAEIDHVLEEVGMTREEFLELQPKHHTELTPSQLDKMRQVREAVPPLNKDSILQKVIDKNKMLKYLSGDETTVGGCVARIEDVADVTTPRDVYYSLRMDYEGTPFSPSKEYAVIRFKTNQYEKYGVPFAEELNSSKAIKPNQYIQYPQTGHGFTAAENGRIVPEFESKYLDGATPTQGEIYVVKDNVEELVGIYDQDTKRFYSIKELPIND